MGKLSLKSKTYDDDSWIGVDLDGTLAHYTGWKGFDHIGDPVPSMVARVKNWIEEGKTVKIMTARAKGQAPERINPIKKWLKEVGLEGLEITNEKDMGMLELYDDRAIQVEKNTGKLIGYPVVG